MVKKAVTLYKKYFKHKPYGWFGDYDDWQQVRAQCTGYDADQIAEKVKTAVLKVKKGEAAYERDSVLFDEIKYSWPLLSALMWVTAKKKGSLHVVDFGGSLGSSYFQNKKYFNDLADVRWNIIEQKKIVSIGKAEIEDERLRFFFTLDECIQQQGEPDVLLLSCALQYFEKPYELIESFLEYNIKHVVIDNTPFNFEARDRLTIQKVPPAIYNASYPCWFLNYEKVKNSFLAKYQLVNEHINDTVIELDGRPIPYKGFVLELKK